MPALYTSKVDTNTPIDKFCVNAVNAWSQGVFSVNAWQTPYFGLYLVISNVVGRSLCLCLCVNVRQQRLARRSLVLLMAGSCLSCKFNLFVFRGAWFEGFWRSLNGLYSICFIYWWESLNRCNYKSVSGGKCFSWNPATLAYRELATYKMIISCHLQSKIKSFTLSRPFFC